VDVAHEASNIWERQAIRRQSRQTQVVLRRANALHRKEFYQARPVPVNPE
jgi:hypothetical protein